MRFKQIIPESTEQQKLLKKYFKIIGKIEFTPEGINIGKDVVLERTDVTEVPFKFNQVRGSFTTQSPKLESVNNFPNQAGVIGVMNTKLLKSTKSTTGEIVCNTLHMSGLGIQDFADTSFKVNVTVVVFNCENLESFNGLDLSTVETISIMNCDKLHDDFSKLPNLKNLTIMGKIPVNMPLMRLFIANKLRYENVYPEKNTRLEDIINQYVNGGQQGPKYAMQLMRELKDNGYFNAARM